MSRFYKRSQGYGDHLEMARVAIGAIVKQEAPYLLEWVYYHKALGFELIIADNGGDDDTSLILSELHKRNVCTRLDFRSIKTSPQIPAYRAILRLARKMKIDIVGFLDCDEFFTRYFPTKSLSPQDGAEYILSEFSKKNATQISYHWVCYGSKTDINDISAPVLERFSYHSKLDDRVNVMGKSFVRVDEVFKASNIFLLGPKILTVHHFHDAANNWYFDEEKIKKFDYKKKVISHNNGAILHYQIKTWGEFQDKRRRGRGDSRVNRYDEHFFKKNDFTEIESEIDKKIINQIKNGTSELLKSIHTSNSKQVAGNWLNDIKIRLLATGLSDIENHRLIQLAYGLYRRIRATAQ